jgi:site-specific DNA-methyltransferase (adenine-specific)
MIKAGCPIGGTVLDPFCGSGTVLRVAERLQRKAVGIDLGYQELAEKRKRFNQIELMV